MRDLERERRREGEKERKKERKGSAWVKLESKGLLFSPDLHLSHD
jgi:hypothetical protein